MHRGVIKKILSPSSLSLFIVVLLLFAPPLDARETHCLKFNYKLGVPASQRRRRPLLRGRGGRGRGRAVVDTVTIIFETRGYLEFAFKPSETRRDGRVERLVTRMRLWDELFEVMIVGMGFFSFLFRFSHAYIRWRLGNFKENN